MNNYNMAAFNDEEITDILEYLQSLKSICREVEKYWYGLEIDRVKYIQKKLQDHLSVLERVVAYQTYAAFCKLSFC